MRRMWTVVGFGLFLVAMVITLAAACAPPAGGKKPVSLELIQLAPEPVDHLTTAMFTSFGHPVLTAAMGLAA